MIYKIIHLVAKSLKILFSQGPFIFWRKFLKFWEQKLTVFRNLRAFEGFNLEGYLEKERKKAVSWYGKNKKRATAVIITFERPDLAENLIKSIRDQEGGKDLEIIVVDNGSSRQTQEKLKKLDVEVILREKEEGFAKAVNTGLRAVRGGDVILLNHDIIAQPYWLETLQHFAYQDYQVGVVGPKLIYPDGKIQFAGGFRNREDPRWWDHCYKFYPENYPPANIPWDVTAVTGACMYIKEEVLKNVGLFDEGFDMSLEDVDFCLRVWEKGFKVSYCPFSSLVHLEGAVRGKTIGKREFNSARHFWKKWGKKLEGRKVTNARGKLKIIYVLLETDIAGGVRLGFEHLNRLKRRGHETYLYTTRGKPDWFKLKAKVKVFKDLAALEEDLSQQEAIKVATWWETAPVVWRASLFRGMPVYFVQDIETSYYRDDLLSQAKVLASYRNEFSYLTESIWVRNRLVPLGHRPEVIPPGIDSQVFRELKNIKRRDDLLLAIGREHYLKNLPMMIAGWKKMKQKVNLWLFGREPHLGLKHRVKYFEKPSDRKLAKLYNQATAFVSTSEHEGFGLPLLEAMACGCPVVCTNAEGNMEFCGDGKNVLLVEKGDSDGLARVLDRLFKDGGLRGRLVREGIRTARRYKWERSIEKLEKVYLGLSKKS